MTEESVWTTTKGNICFLEHQSLIESAAGMAAIIVLANECGSDMAEMYKTECAARLLSLQEEFVKRNCDISIENDFIPMFEGKMQIALQESYQILQNLPK